MSRQDRAENALHLMTLGWVDWVGMLVYFGQVLQFLLILAGFMPLVYLGLREAAR